MSHIDTAFLTVTLDINLLYDKAEGREGVNHFDAIIKLAKQGKLRLYFTATTDFEDRSGAAMRIAIGLLMEGILQEDPNAGTSLDRMPFGPGTYLDDDPSRYELLRALWPEASFVSRSMENKEHDVLGLQAHKRNGRDVYLTGDKELLRKSEVLKKRFQITVMNPKQLLALFESQP